MVFNIGDTQKKLGQITFSQKILGSYLVLSVGDKRFVGKGKNRRDALTNAHLFPDGPDNTDLELLIEDLWYQEYISKEEFIACKTRAKEWKLEKHFSSGEGI